mmetsp:Transcript_28235/g.62455  ORF Transcript_28235/g.62455 Transcript_28235/m.62455 type:complete len:410 (-) Transcript_28235:7-1236(-)
MGFLIKLAAAGVLREKQAELDKAKEAETAADTSGDNGSTGSTGVAPAQGDEAAEAQSSQLLSSAELSRQEERDAEDKPKAPIEDDVDDGGRKFVWDPLKRELVEVGVAERKARRKVRQDGPNAQKGGKADAEEKELEDGECAENILDDEDEEEEEEDDDVDDDSASSEHGDLQNVEDDSRALFLEEASTPELIKQAVSVGGPMADAVLDRWVFDEATKLHFRMDRAGAQMYCWNMEQGCLYEWQTSRKLRFVWASPNGPSEPPAALPSAPGAVQQPMQVADGSTRQRLLEASESAGAAMAASPTEARGQEPHKALWITIIPPSVLTGGWADPAEQLTEVMELNGRAMAAVIGKGGNNIKEIQQSTGVKATSRTQDGEKNGAVLLMGTRVQIAAAKAAIEQRLFFFLLGQ